MSLIISQSCVYLQTYNHRKISDTTVIHNTKHFKAESFCNDIYYSLKSLQCNSDPDITKKNLFNIIVNVVAGHAPSRKLSRKEKKIKSKP